MPRYFLSDKLYSEMLTRASSDPVQCKLLGETYVMHTKQNTSGTINRFNISTGVQIHWTTPIFYPNSTGNTTVNLSISHSSVNTGFEIKAVAFSVTATSAGCDCIFAIGPDGPVDYDPNNQSFDPTGFDFSGVTGQTLDSINTFTFNDLIVDCCDAVIGICVEYRWTVGRGYGDITINTDVDGSYVDSDLAHNDCKPYNLRNPFQHNFVRQNDRVIEGFLLSRSNAVSAGINEFITDNNLLNSSTSLVTLSSIFGNSTLSQLTDYTNLFSLFDSNQAFAKKVNFTNLAGTQTVVYNVTLNAQIVGSDPDIFDIGISYVSGSITYIPGDIVKISLVF